MIRELPDSVLFERFETLCVPILGHLYLTSTCQLECVHCYRRGSGSGDVMSAAEWMRLLNEFKEEGTMDLTISGGEPLLHPGWREIIAEASRLKFGYEVMTNGLAMTAQDLEFLMEHHCGQLHVSMHGWGAPHDEFVGRAGSFAHAKELVERAVSVGVKTVVKMSLFSANFSEADRIAEWCRSCGAIFGPSYYIIPRFAPGSDDFLECRLTPEQIRACEMKYPEWTGRPPFAACFEDNGPYFCNMGWMRFAVDAEGLLYPCSQVAEPVGEVRTKRFREVWRYAPRLNELRMKKGLLIARCADCSMDESCKFRCMGQFHLSTGSYETPAPEHCEITASWLGLDKWTGMMESFSSSRGREGVHEDREG